MNPKYYTTASELERVVKFLDKHSIGGGVVDIVIPKYFGPASIPVVKDREMHGCVLANEVEMNAGLVLDLMERYSNEQFVVSMLRANASGR